MEKRTKFALALGSVAAVTAAWLALDGHFSEVSAETIPTPDDLGVTSFKTLDLLLDQVSSGYVDAESVMRLQNVLDYRLADLDKLIAAMEEVAPSDSKEMIELQSARNQLGVIRDRVAVVAQRINVMDRADIMGFRVNTSAAQLAKQIPNFIDVDALQKTHQQVISLYNGVTYGEVLIKDENGNLVEKNVRDLIKIGNTSDKISPALAHRLFESLYETTSGKSGWQLNSGAFERVGDHGVRSDHIRSPQWLNTADIRPTGGNPEGADAKRLGEFLLKNRDNPAIHFFQLEAGKKISVLELKKLIIAEWQDKVTPQELQYMLSKVKPGGSGIHFHIEFKGPAYHTAYVPPTVVASR